MKGSSPANVVAALTEEPRAQLLDIRSAADVKAEGSPDLKGTKRRALSLPYSRVGYTAALRTFRKMSLQSCNIVTVQLMDDI